MFLGEIVPPFFSQKFLCNIFQKFIPLLALILSSGVRGLTGVRSGVPWCKKKLEKHCRRPQKENNNLNIWSFIHAWPGGLLCRVVTVTSCVLFYWKRPLRVAELFVTDMKHHDVSLNMKYDAGACVCYFLSLRGAFFFFYRKTTCVPF